MATKYSSTVMTGAQRKAMFASKTDDWATPLDFFTQLDAEFGFTLDPCASDANHKTARYFTAPNGLLERWAPERVFMNPPYGREIGKWTRKATLESVYGALVVALLPARTDTAWWHDHVMRADEIRFIRGRLRYNDGPRQMRAPFPSAIVIWRPVFGLV